MDFRQGLDDTVRISISHVLFFIKATEDPRLNARFYLDNFRSGSCHTSTSLEAIEFEAFATLFTKIYSRDSKLIPSCPATPQGYLHHSSTLSSFLGTSRLTNWQCPFRLNQQAGITTMNVRIDEILRLGTEPLFVTACIASLDLDLRTMGNQALGPTLQNFREHRLFVRRLWIGCWDEFEGMS